MNHKIKSLFYLTAFIFASAIYTVAIDKNLKEFSEQIELADANSITHTDSEDHLNDTEK